MKAEEILKVEDIRTKSDDELNELLVTFKKAQFNMRFQQATGQLENTANFKKVRRNIARVKTVQRQRALQSQGS